MRYTPSLQLKNCPFCGGKANSYIDLEKPFQKIFIGCDKCKFNMNELIHFPIKLDWMTDTEKNEYIEKCEKKIVNRWNTRNQERN